LIEAAKTWKAEKIIMGAHGRGTCPHFLIGSVSKAVAASAPCTVEVIRIADKN
jgi:nucleotide-binding universal stress UspA family protein